MGLDIFFSEDIHHRLDALQAAALHYPSGEFRQGWLAALDAVALAFGLDGAAERRRDTLVIPRKEVVPRDKNCERR